MIVQTTVGSVIETLTNKKLAKTFLYYFNLLVFHFDSCRLLNQKRCPYVQIINRKRPLVTTTAKGVF